MLIQPYQTRLCEHPRRWESGWMGEYLVCSSKTQSWWTHVAPGHSCHSAVSWASARCRICSARFLLKTRSWWTHVAPGHSCSSVVSWASARCRVRSARLAVSGSLSSYVWVQEGSDEVLTLFTRFCRGAAWLCLLGHRG